MQLLFCRLECFRCCPGNLFGCILYCLCCFTCSRGCFFNCTSCIGYYMAISDFLSCISNLCRGILCRNCSFLYCPCKFRYSPLSWNFLTVSLAVEDVSRMTFATSLTFFSDIFGVYIFLAIAT
jgi:hypothetical protein